MKIGITGEIPRTCGPPPLIKGAIGGFSDAAPTHCAYFNLVLYEWYMKYCVKIPLRFFRLSIRATRGIGYRVIYFVFGPRTKYVVPRRETWIAEHEHAPVVHVADEPSRALLQRDHGRRDLPVRERIAARLAERIEPRDVHGIVRCRER